MSHVVSIKTKAKDVDVIRLTCATLSLPEAQHGTVRFYDGRSCTGIKVQLPGWRYPIVIEADGTIRTDSFGGAWGRQSELDAFMRHYGIEATKRAMRLAGRPLVSESVLPSGEVKLVFAG